MEEYRRFQEEMLLFALASLKARKRRGVQNAAKSRAAEPGISPDAVVFNLIIR
jgi:hypothetical protein